MTKIIKIKIFTATAVVFLLLSCKDFVAVEPPDTAISAKMIFTNDATANSALTGIYAKMIGSGGGFASGTNSITFLCGLQADELVNNSATDVMQMEFFNNQVSATNGKLQTTWAEFYNYIYTANAVIEGLNASSAVTASLKNQLKGEALFIRAFCHFYLANLYGAVPVVSASDYRINARISRSSVNEVYAFVVKDLTSAKQLLMEPTANSPRTRPNQMVAAALLARVYLYQQDWGNAELMATSVIQNKNYAFEEKLNDTFLTASKEAIWQLQAIVPQYNTFDGLYFILSAAPTRVSLRSAFVESMLPTDQRRINWIGQIKPNGTTYYYPFKYKVRFLATAQTPPTEYLMVLRLAEQYLIRAEARAAQNKITGAIADLNTIRGRAKIGDTDAGNQAALLLAVREERRIEFFAEWGHRWFDLKRTHTTNGVLGQLKPNWKPGALDLPIPQLETQRNPNL